MHTWFHDQLDKNILDGLWGAGAIAVSVGPIVFFIGIIVFEIWTIIVAKNARKEIKAIEDEEDA